jgi:hypothetical protein
VLWLALAVGNLLADKYVLGFLYGALALSWAGQWWFDPRPHLAAVIADALLVRRGVRSRSIGRAELLGVRAVHTGGYGLELTVAQEEPIRLVSTAPRFSVADAQAGALRRWAGLPPVS